MAAPVAPGRLGHLPQLAVRRVDFLQSIRAQGEIVRIFLGNRPVFVLNSPAAVHDVLVTQSRKFGKGLLFDIARPFIGNGIITSERDFHRRQRRALQPAFHRDSIAAFVGRMTDSAEEQVSAWIPGEVIAMDLVMRRMMTGMLVATLFSTERQDGTAGVAELAELGERAAEHLTTVMRGASWALSCQRRSRPRPCWGTASTCPRPRRCANSRTPLSGRLGWTPPTAATCCRSCSPAPPGTRRG
ncbi:cytochrome P450 [Streptomyces abikoensis]|uniref:cytochrome P450 n=1 Tax=Streptomyces TaxID=1883 RepID=UPI0033C86340